MKRLLLSTLVLLATGTALAATPRTALETLAGDLDWAVQEDADLCSGIDANAQSTSWPADRTSQLKYIATLPFMADGMVDSTKLMLDLESSIKPVIPWHQYRDTYARIYRLASTPGYVYSFWLVNAVDSDGPTGKTVVCVTVLGIRS